MDLPSEVFYVYKDFLKRDGDGDVVGIMEYAPVEVKNAFALVEDSVAGSLRFKDVRTLHRKTA